MEPAPTDVAEDPRIAEFHRANLRRKAIIFAALGVICVAAGVITIVVLVQPGVDLENKAGRRPGAGYTLIFVGAGIVLGGLGCLVAAYRSWRGQDVELDSMSL
jgi:hypothetical protein